MRSRSRRHEGIPSASRSCGHATKLALLLLLSTKTILQINDSKYSFPVEVRNQYVKIDTIFHFPCLTTAVEQPSLLRSTKNLTSKNERTWIQIQLLCMDLAAQCICILTHYGRRNWPQASHKQKPESIKIGAVDACAKKRPNKFGFEGLRIHCCAQKLFRELCELAIRALPTDEECL